MYDKVTSPITAKAGTSIQIVDQIVAGVLSTGAVLVTFEKLRDTSGIDSNGNSSSNNQDKRPMTNKEADAAAEKRGYKKTNYYTRNRARVYQKGNRYISADVDSHSGGTWKMADSVENLNSKATRMGTYDANLNWIGD